MLALGVILTILGVIGVAYGAWSAGAVRAGTDFLGISSIFFGTVVLIAGAAFLYSGRNEARRARIKHAVGAKEFTLVAVLAAILYIFWAINPNYLSLNNIRNIFNSAFIVGTIAVGMSCLLISGSLDLSAGNTGMFAGVLVSLLLRDGMAWGLPFSSSCSSAP